MFSRLMKKSHTAPDAKQAIVVIELSGHTRRVGRCPLIGVEQTHGPHFSNEMLGYSCTRGERSSLPQLNSINSFKSLQKTQARWSFPLIEEHAGAGPNRI